MIAATPARMLSPDVMNRRLATGIVISLLLHGFVLSLQFGVPGFALPGRAPAISVSLADPVQPAPQPLPEAAAPVPLPPAPEPAPARAAAGLTLVDPAPAPAPPPAPRREAMVRKDKPRRQRRISAPMPLPGLDAATRVIAQADDAASDFVVPLPQPEEALQKTVDMSEAQHGEDVVPEVATVAEPDQAALALAEQEQQELERQRAGEEGIAAEASRQEALLAEQRRLDEAVATERRAQELAERQRAEEQLALQRRTEEIAARQKTEEAVAQQRRMQELAERQRAEELLAQQRRMLELADRRKAEEQLAQQRSAQEAAERRRLEEEMAARRLAGEQARQQAERERQLAQEAGSAPSGDPFGPPGGQGGNQPAKAPAATYGGNLANKVRELSKGLDLLSGSPPPRQRIDDSGAPRRVVADSSQRDVPLRMYVESWRQKIERNGALNFPKLIGDRARIDPLVSVAVRSDGSIEDVTIVRSSGRADTDDAVRRIVRLNARYSAFPPMIAARYDVIEIRRVWTFDQVLKLIEELR
ncbi:MAG: TonB C-terminal domain-containing protein [Telluria sp.]